MLRKFSFPVRPLETRLKREITVAVLGAGSRGNEYTEYGLKYPGTLRVVAVADIREGRRNAMGDIWNIPADRRFGDYHELLARGRLADMLIVSLPDDLHVEPALAAMRQGYDILLEKPMARTAEECETLLKCQRETGVLVMVGHVLRHAPFFEAVKSAIDGGFLGDVVNIQLQEPVKYSHMAHSYVRGNWRDSRATNPMILAKSCHDLDILKWLVGRRSEAVSCEGGLYLFKSENAPAGAPQKCTDGCPHEAECPYSAIDIYARKRRHLHVFDLKRETATEEEILKALRTTEYGRCVYHCDNDQPDHLGVVIRFEGGVTATFSMDAFTPWGGRRIRVMGTRGYLEGDGTSLSIHDFRSGESQSWTADLGGAPDNGHAGGDLALIRDFLEAIDARDEKRLASSLAESVESHLMAFACEKSRLNGTKERILM